MLYIVELLAVFSLLLLLAASVFALHYVRKQEQNGEEQATDRERDEDSRSVAENAVSGARRRRRTALSRARHQAVSEQGATDHQPGIQREDAIEAGASSSSGRRSRKKDANREARREAQAARAAELEAALERQAEEEEARAAADAAEEEAAAKAEEEERKRREEKEKKEREEYESWKHLISVEDAGEAASKEMEEDPNLLQKFCDYIKTTKVIVLEELAAEFDMSTEQTVDRLTRLEENGTITGFFDDRGKFVYVSTEEMKDVASFIRKRGRVSIMEIAAESTRLLRLDAIVQA